jgi:hypothetical protein
MAVCLHWPIFGPSIPAHILHTHFKNLPSLSIRTVSVAAHNTPHLPTSLHRCAATHAPPDVGLPSAWWDKLTLAPDASRQDRRCMKLPDMAMLGNGMAYVPLTQVRDRCTFRVRQVDEAGPLHQSRQYHSSQENSTRTPGRNLLQRWTSALHKRR